MRVAVTGGTGFVGGHLLEALRRRDWPVAALARSAAGRRAVEALGCRAVAGDLEDATALAALVEGAQVVFHCAGLVEALSDAAFHRVNAEGTGRVARAAAAAGVERLVHVSSLAVTGPAVRGRPLDERATPRPLTAYGRSKLAGEEAVRRSGARFTIVRPPVVYGPGDRQLLPVFRLARRGVVLALGDPTQELSLVYGPDLAEALLAVATSAACEARTYHAVHPEIVTQRLMGASIARAMGRRGLRVTVPGGVLRAAAAVAGLLARARGRPVLLSDDRAAEFLAPAWIASPEALARDAGWTAATALEPGIAATARWYRDAGWL